MAHSDIYDWARDHDYDIENISDEQWDKMESQLEELEEQTIAEYSDQDCQEVMMMFKVKKKGSKNG